MDEHALWPTSQNGGKKKTTVESLGFNRCCCLYVSNTNNLLHTFYALVIVQINSKRIQSRLTPSAASVALWSCFPDIWRPLQAKDAARNLGGRSHPVLVWYIVDRPGGIKDPTSVVELRQTRFSRVSIWPSKHVSHIQVLVTKTLFSQPHPYNWNWECNQVGRETCFS
jgi:hypothetical protein